MINPLNNERAAFKVR